MPATLLVQVCGLAGVQTIRMGKNLGPSDFEVCLFEPHWRFRLSHTLYRVWPEWSPALPCTLSGHNVVRRVKNRSDISQSYQQSEINQKEVPSGSLPTGLFQVLPSFTWANIPQYVKEITPDLRCIASGVSALRSALSLNAPTWVDWSPNPAPRKNRPVIINDSKRRSGYNPCH